MNSIQAANSVEMLAIGGRVLPIRQLKFREWAELQSWLKSAVPSPMAEAIRALSQMAVSGEHVPLEVRSSVLAQAQEEARYWPPRVGSWAWIRALESIEGGRAKFLHRAVLAGGTEISEEEAFDLIERADTDEVINLIRVCLHGDPPIPKAMAGSMTTNRTTPPISMNGDLSSTK